jgi:hypothetical protein
VLCFVVLCIKFPSFSGVSILDCHVGFLFRLFILENILCKLTKKRYINSQSRQKKGPSKSSIPPLQHFFIITYVLCYSTVTREKRIVRFAQIHKIGNPNKLVLLIILVFLCVILLYFLYDLHN